MATLSSAALLAQNTNDANFRAWTTFVRDSFLLGWVQTGDTGQMNFTTVTFPTTVNTKQGYTIFRMNDTLQSTAPVFIRIDYGSSAAALTPGIWVTIGTGSDGAGAITTKRFDGGAVVAPTVASTGNNLTANISYGSAANNRIQCALFTQNGVQQIIFNIERSKDSTGADTADGILFYYNNISGSLNKMLYIVMGSATQPIAELGFCYVLSSNNPSSFGGEIGIAIPIPMKGFGQPPGLGLVITRFNDFGAGSTISVTMYGVAVSFQQVQAQVVLNHLGTADNNTRIFIRYE